MKKSTARIIVVAVSILVVLNVLLIAVLWSKQGRPEKKRGRPIEEINAFIIEELELDEQQAQVFTELSLRHHQIQRQNMESFRKTKSELNARLINGGEDEMDSLITAIATITESKEKELYRFFKEVLIICNDDQKKRLQSVFVEATGRPPYGRMPFNQKGSKDPRPPR